MEKKGAGLMYDFMTYTMAMTSLTRAEKIGQLFMPAAFINDNEAEIKQLEKLIRDHHIGGLCFFHSRASAATNYEGRKEVIFNEHSFEVLKKLILRYQKIARYPLLIAIDAEWGLAMRVENTPQYPYAITLGALRNKEEFIFEMGRNIALDCRKAGIHWNFAPVLDINNNPNNPVIGYRSFGEDKVLVVNKANAYIKGMEKEGVLTALKHFPGHGDTAEDSHLGLPLISKSKEDLLANELYPFRELINSGADAVMVGHLAVPALTQSEKIPTSISEKAIKGILRQEMGFKGIVVSDALNMHAVSKLFATKGELEWQAFNAGNDVLCFAEHIPEGIDMINELATDDQLEESFERLWRLKLKALKHTRTATRPLSISPSELNANFALESLTLYSGVEDFKTFIEGGFIGIEISTSPGHPFFKTIQDKVAFPIYSSSDSTLNEISLGTEHAKNVLLALYPPKVKPQNNFDITAGELSFVQQLILEKNVVLYLFGSPYVLNLLNVQKAKAVILAYQDFEAFQHHAARHFAGEVMAKGKLPVNI